MNTKPIQLIKLGQRHRKDLGDLESLADSIAEQGLLQPIGITKSDELVFGERRLRACRDILGLAEIETRIVDVTSIVEGEHAENEIRKAFTPSERVAIADAIAAEIGNRQGQRTDRALPENIPEVGTETRTVVAKKAGFGNDRTFRQAKEIVEAAEAEPERYAPLVEQMDRTGKVGGAHKRLTAERKAEQLRSTANALPAGKYRAIYADPPWQFRVWSGAGKDRAAENHYPTMTLADIKALPIRDMATDDCALFMWAVMPQLPEAIEVMEAWGFEYKTCAFVWVKTTKDEQKFAMGMGYWTRANAELCLLGTRGSPTRLNADVQQVISSPRGVHSRKPSETYDRIERLVSGPYVELFARTDRQNWTGWGYESPLNGGAE